jgi:hypothetical protein
LPWWLTVSCFSFEACSIPTGRMRLHEVRRGVRRVPMAFRRCASIHQVSLQATWVWTIQWEHKCCKSGDGSSYGKDYHNLFDYLVRSDYTCNPEVGC